MDPTIGAVAFTFFGFWFSMWWAFVGITWALRALKRMRFRYGR